MAPQKDNPDAAIADSCIQPVEYSYTIASLEKLLHLHGFEYLAPCVSQFNKTATTLQWNMTFADPALRKHYDALPDFDRWQITNLLLLERSPHLWFYIQRRDSGRTRRTESQLCEEFMDRTFKRVSTKKSVYIRTDNGGYQLMSGTHNYPPPHFDATCRKLLTAVAERPNQRMRDILSGIGVADDFMTINGLRLMLTTCSFPYLIDSDFGD